MTIRSYRPEDLDEILQLFYDTVHAVNARDYAPEQLDAWADGRADRDAWNRSLLEHDTRVALSGETIVGFADMDENGYLDRLYVHRDFQGKGIASALCDKLESGNPVPKYRVHASITARPFFEKRGYAAVYEQQVERHGILLTNFAMEKSGPEKESGAKEEGGRGGSLAGK